MTEPHTDPHTDPDAPEHGWERWTPETHDELIRAALTGQTPDEVAARFGRTTNAVRQRLAKLYAVAALRDRGVAEDTITAWIGFTLSDVPEHLHASGPTVHAWDEHMIDALCGATLYRSTRTSSDPDDVTCTDCRALLPAAPE